MSSRFAVPDNYTPEAHHELVLKMWTRMDRDQSESITRLELDCEEFRSALKSMIAPKTHGALGGKHNARAELSMKQALTYCMRKADLNGDGTLSFDEFKSFTNCLRQKTLSQHTANLIFALFDVKFDGFIGEDEFKEMFRFYQGRNPSEKEFQDEWAMLHASADRLVSRQQYISWLQTTPTLVFRQHAPPVEEDVEDHDGNSLMHTQGSFGSFSRELLPSLSGSIHERSTSSWATSSRPNWNQRFNAGVNANQKIPKSTRSYFSRPQSLPELQRHYQSHRGFHEMLDRIKIPELKKTPTVLSTDSGCGMLPHRAIPGGFMRSRSTGRLEKWKDHWQTPACLKSQYQPGTLSFRCPGPPPQWMYGDGD